MSDFSTRFGFKPEPIELEVTAMPDALRNGLWDCCKVTFFSNIGTGYRDTPNSTFENLADKLWHNIFKVPIDTQNSYSANQMLKQIRSKFFAYKFFEVYNFIEFLAKYGSNDPNEKSRFLSNCNRVLEREKSVFRFAANELVKISDPVDLEEIEIAIQQPSAHGVSEHIRSAAAAFSSRPPDYRNCVKEVISAVESAVFYINGKKDASLKNALNLMKQSHPIHPALEAGWIKLYAYTSDQDGIRHAMLENKDISHEEARYMLVSCSAFANYLISMKK